MLKDLPDFDSLMSMARQSPEKLEQLRDSISQDTIDAAPAHCKDRLRGLQFEIDSQRKLCKSPLAACIRISQMMHHSFEDLRCSLNKKADEHQSLQTAKVLSFKNN